MSILSELEDTHYQHGQVNGLAGITLSSVSGCHYLMCSGKLPEYLIPLEKGCIPSFSSAYDSSSGRA